MSNPENRGFHPPKSEEQSEKENFLNELALKDMPAAIEKIYPRILRLANILLLRYRVRFSEPEDLAHQVIERALKYKDQFSGENFTGWIDKIVENHVINQVKLKEHNLIQMKRRKAVRIVDKEKDPEKLFQDAVKKQIISEVYNSLSEQQKQVWRLRKDGMGYKEIAEQLNISVSSVGTYLARIKERLIKSQEQKKGKK